MFANLDILRRFSYCETLRFTASVTSLVHRRNRNSRSSRLHIVLVCNCIIHAVLQRLALVANSNDRLPRCPVAHIDAAGQDDLCNAQVLRICKLHNEIRGLHRAESVRHHARILRIIRRLHVQNTAVRRIDPRPAGLIVKFTFIPHIAKAAGIIRRHPGPKLHAGSLRNIRVCQFVPDLIIRSARTVDRYNRKLIIQHYVKIHRQYIAISIVNFADICPVAIRRHLGSAAIADRSHLVSIWIKPLVANLPALAAARFYCECCFFAFLTQHLDPVRITTVHHRCAVRVSLKACTNDHLEFHASGIAAAVRETTFIESGFLCCDAILIAIASEDGRRIAARRKVEPSVIESFRIICCNIDLKGTRLLHLLCDGCLVLVVAVKRQRSIRRRHLEIILNYIEIRNAVITTRILNDALIAHRFFRFSAHRKRADHRIRSSCLLSAAHSRPRRIFEVPDIPSVLCLGQVAAFHYCIE